MIPIYYLHLNIGPSINSLCSPERSTLLINLNLPPLTEMRACEGMPKTADTILNGTYKSKYEIPTEMQAFFAALKMTEVEKIQPPVIGTVPGPIFRRCSRLLQKARPATPRISTTHFGKQ